MSNVMFDSSPTLPPIVFLHIPKTAGQTVHNELARSVGRDAVSPIRLHTQANSESDQFPPGYALYSGHIDWTKLDQIPKVRFTFTILRDPRERIASFYFYLLNEATALGEMELLRPENSGKQAVLSQSVDDYFFGGNKAWQQFILDHYDNFYCRYLGTQKVRAGATYAQFSDGQKIDAAHRNLSRIDWVYSLDNLAALEEDMRSLYGFSLDLVNRRDNAGVQPIQELRWPKLIALFESDKSCAKLENFVTLDLKLMERLEL